MQRDPTKAELWLAGSLGAMAGLLVWVAIAVWVGGCAAHAADSPPAVSSTTFDNLVLIIGALVTALGGSAGGMLGARRSYEHRLTKLEALQHRLRADLDKQGEKVHWNGDCIMILAGHADVDIPRRPGSKAEPEPTLNEGSEGV